MHCTVIDIFGDAVKQLCAQLPLHLKEAAPKQVSPCSHKVRTRHRPMTQNALCDFERELSKIFAVDGANVYKSGVTKESPCHRCVLWIACSLFESNDTLNSRCPNAFTSMEISWQSGSDNTTIFCLLDPSTYIYSSSFLRPSEKLSK